jgi:hypothetical protein
MRTSTILAAAGTIAAAIPAATIGQAVSNAPLIPRDALFGNPERAAGRVSPDGKWRSE